MAKPPKLQIVTANHLLEGHSVFLAGDGWTADHRRALVAGADASPDLEAAARADEDANLVVGVYLVEVQLDAQGHPEPTHYREKLRARARPSFWPNEPARAKPSRSARASREGCHVSL
jgi:hypothetical protein